VSEVEQGQLGDCYLLGALSVVSVYVSLSLSLCMCVSWRSQRGTPLSPSLPLSLSLSLPSRRPQRGLSISVLL